MRGKFHRSRQWQFIGRCQFLASRLCRMFTQCLLLKLSLTWQMMIFETKSSVSGCFYFVFAFSPNVGRSSLGFLFLSILFGIGLCVVLFYKMVPFVTSKKRRSSIIQAFDFTGCGVLWSWRRGLLGKAASDKYSSVPSFAIWDEDYYS